ncbi:hypothetical protein DOY81_006030 [Sarcophaga bullata]|nr:hypothetical protein DOY81_006030 [Sarcophaga bullata]
MNGRNKVLYIVETQTVILADDLSLSFCDWDYKVNGMLPVIA